MSATPDAEASPSHFRSLATAHTISSIRLTLTCSRSGDSANAELLRPAPGRRTFDRFQSAWCGPLGPSEKCSARGRMDDILAVLDDADSRRATLFGVETSANVCALFAATYPERCERLILAHPYPRAVRSDAYPHGGTGGGLGPMVIRTRRERWGDRDLTSRTMRSLALITSRIWDPRSSPAVALAAWIGGSGSFGLAMSRRLTRRLRHHGDGDFRISPSILSSIRVPTLHPARRHARPRWFRQRADPRCSHGRAWPPLRRRWSRRDHSVRARQGTSRRAGLGPRNRALYGHRRVNRAIRGAR